MIPLVFSINDDYVKYILTALTSIIDNIDKDSKLCIYILYKNLSAENKDIISRLEGLYIEINYINLNNVIDMDLQKFLDIRQDYNYISIETFYRFFIPDLFPNYDKIIYLDADIIVLSDISKLYNLDINDYFLGAVLDINIYFVRQKKFLTSKGINFDKYFEEVLEKKSKDYFNAGVLLLNLKKIRQNNMVKKLWEYAQKKSPLEFQDQDILNSIFEDKFKYIDLSFNLLKDAKSCEKQLKDKNLKKQIKKSCKNPVIVHYVGANKPWIYNKYYTYDYSFIDEWWKYYRKTYFYKKQDEKIFKLIKRNSKNNYKFFELHLLNYPVIKFCIEDKRFIMKLFIIKISIVLNKVNEVLKI